MQRYTRKQVQIHSKYSIRQRCEDLPRKTGFFEVHLSQRCRFLVYFSKNAYLCTSFFYIFSRYPKNYLSKLMETYKKFKFGKLCIKLYIALTGVFFTLYCGLLVLGMRNYIAELITITMTFGLLCSALWMYRFCWLSWAFLTYIYAIFICIVLYHEGVFGEYVYIAHRIAFGIGATLSSYFIINCRKYLNCDRCRVCCYEKES